MMNWKQVQGVGFQVQGCLPLYLKPNTHSSFRIHHFSKIYSTALRRGDEGAEVAREAPGVVVEKLAHAFEAGRADDETDVVLFLNAEDYLRVVVGRGVRVLLPRKRERDAAVLAPRLKTTDPTPARMRDLDARPLAPEV